MKDGEMGRASVEDLTDAERKQLNDAMALLRECYLSNVRQPHTKMAGVQIYFEGGGMRARPLVDVYLTK